MLSVPDATLAAVTDVFRAVFMDDGLVLTASTAPRDIPGWDSLTNISLILAVQRELRINFTARELGSFRNVGDLLACVAAKRGMVAENAAG